MSSSSNHLLQTPSVRVRVERRRRLWFLQRAGPNFRLSYYWSSWASSNAEENSRGH